MSSCSPSAAAARSKHQQRRLSLQTALLIAGATAGLTYQLQKRGMKERIFLGKGFEGLALDKTQVDVGMGLFSRVLVGEGNRRDARYVAALRTFR